MNHSLARFSTSIPSGTRTDMEDLLSRTVKKKKSAGQEEWSLVVFTVVDSPAFGDLTTTQRLDALAHIANLPQPDGLGFKIHVKGRDSGLSLAQARAISSDLPTNTEKGLETEKGLGTETKTETETETETETTLFLRPMTAKFAQEWALLKVRHVLQTFYALNVFTYGIALYTLCVQRVEVSDVTLLGLWAKPNAKPCWVGRLFVMLDDVKASN